MADSDGKVRIIIDTNADNAANELDKVSKSFDKTAKEARQASSVYNQFEQENTQLVEKLREIALAGGQNGNEFKRLANIYRDNKKALDEADSAVQKITGGLRNQQSGMSSLLGAAKGLIGGYIGLQGAIKAFNFSMESVTAFRTQERAISGLNTALKNAGVYSDEYSSHIQSLASEIQRYSNYGDEAIIKAQAVGQAFVGQTRITDDLTKAVVDFAAANEMDLDSAFRLVGKSIGSETNALARYGIELKKGMSDSEKMAAITRQLGERYKEQAAQMADASVQLKNSIGDMKESFGAILNGYVTNWQQGMNKMVQATTGFINQIRVMHAEVSSLSTADLEQRYNKNVQELAEYAGARTRGSYELLKREAALKAENNLILQQIKYIKEQQKISQNNKPFKMTDEIAISSGSAATSGKSSHVQQMKDAYDQLQVSIQKTKREIELAALKYGTSSEQVQQAFIKYRELTGIQAEISKLFEEQKIKVEEHKGAYQQLTDKVSDLTAKLRDLAAEQKIGSDDWMRYKQDLDSAKLELNNVNKSLEDNGIKIEDYSKKISSSISSGLINAVRSGGNAFEAFSNIAVSALQKVLDKLLEMSVVTPILNAFTGGTGGTIFSALTNFFKSADGNVFKNGNVIPFAKGGIVQQPTIFPMANGGTGLMGEAGAEAVMPLRRMSNGRLGVEADTKGGQVVNIYNYSGANVETRKRDDNTMDVFIRRVNDALANERTSGGFRSAYSRENNKGVQAV